MIPLVFHHSAARPLHPSWPRLHPHGEQRSWTDDEAGALLAAHYPTFHTILGYGPFAAAAARYFVVHHQGGVWVDADVEALRPLEALLAAHPAVLGQEPAAHLDDPGTRRQGLRQLVSDRLLASEAGHAFWEHLFRELLWSFRARDAREAAGCFVLSRALASYAGPAPVYLAPAAELCPLHDAQCWEALAEEERGQIRTSAYAVQHWMDAQAPLPPAGLGEAALLRVSVAGKPALETTPPLANWRAARREGMAEPFITCILDAGDDAEAAVESFLAQTYAARELLILGRPPAGLPAAPAVRILDVPWPQALAEARGDLVAVWDAATASAPERLEAQAAALWSFGLDACVLGRRHLVWPAARRLGTSAPGAWADTLLAPLALVPSGLGERARPDLRLVARLARRGRLGILDAPGLSVRVGGEEELAQCGRAATWRGPRYDAALRQLALPGLRRLAAAR